MKKLLTGILSVVLTFTFLFATACSKEKSQSVNIKYADASTIMASLVNDTLDYGLLPEPAATKLERVVGKDYSWERLDLQKLYNSETGAYPQAVLMVKNSVLESYPNVVEKIKTETANVVNYAKENTASVVSAIETKYSSTSLKPAVHLTASAIDNCKIYWQDANISKNYVNDYIEDILSVEIGLDITPAKRVGDNFFFTSITASADYSDKEFTFTVPDGAPALAISNLIATNNNLGAKAIDYNVVNAENINGYINGTFGYSDFVIMPLNAATLSYNNNYTMVSVITHGNLYLMSKTQHVNGLVDKTVGVIGQGKVPDLTLKCVLNKAKLNVKVVV